MHGFGTLKGQNQFNRVSLRDTFARRKAQEKLKPDLSVPVQHCRYVKGRRKLTPEQRAKRDLVMIGIAASAGAGAMLTAWLLGADIGLMFVLLCYVAFGIIGGFIAYKSFRFGYTNS